MARQPRTPRGEVLQALRLVEKRTRLVKQLVLHVPIEIVPPAIYAAHLVTAMLGLYEARRLMGEWEDGSGLSKRNAGEPASGRGRACPARRGRSKRRPYSGKNAHNGAGSLAGQQERL